MKPDEDFGVINPYWRHLRVSNRSGSHLNCFRFGKNETKKHRDLKYKVFCELREQNLPVVTEAIFENGSRPDIVDLYNGIIVEVCVTETLEEAKEKAKKYPGEFTVEYVQVKKEPKYGCVKVHGPGPV